MFPPRYLNGLLSASYLRKILVSALTLLVLPQCVPASPPQIASPPSASAALFELVQGDRVVLLGDGLIEQEQYHGWVELMLTRAFSNADVTYRNLGWSADTPAGASRFGLSLLQAGYEPEDEGWKQLQEQLRQSEPTVVILGYGMASSLELGSEQVDTFVNEYRRLIGFLKQLNSEVRLLFLSPLSRVEASTDTPLATQRAKDIDGFARAIANLAKEVDGHFVDLSDVARTPELRRDAIHLNDQGYQELASHLATALQLQPGAWREASELQKAILKKNEWFFHRSRPANMAYVFGFRKREQGQNAVEIPQFDVLIKEEETRIAQLRKPDAPQIDPKPSRTKSQYAKFEAQPLPEFTTADGLEISLWAENPMLNKPIQMNFDTAGRLWVASSEAYPMIEVGQTANDRILVLEDTNQDGRADRSTVFADGLLIPTGVIPAEDGAYVAQSTDLLHLRDTDGDGTADQKIRVLSGFGTEDTHHNLHSLQWGPDGRLFMNQSVYTRTDAETPRGVTRLKAGGGFRYEPSTMRMQVFFAGLWNSWGHQFDRWGRSFMSDGAGFAGLAYVFPGAQFRPVPRGQRFMDLISPGNYPKFCSLEIVEGETFPDDWQHSIITCDFRANRVTRFSLKEDGAGYQTVQEADLLRTSTATFRPIDVKQGPDGALYIADWSNPIINHGEVDFRDPRRDRWHGRIWRVAFRDQKPKPIHDFRKLSQERLSELLIGNDRYARDRARRVLLSRRKKTLEQLPKWLARQSDDFAQLQGLWLYQGLRTANTSLLSQLLQNPSAEVRSAAVRVLADWADPETDVDAPMSRDEAIEWYRRLIQDSHPRVQLETILGLTTWRDPEAVRVALSIVDNKAKPDRFLAFALGELVRDATGEFLPTLDDEPLADQQLEFVLTQIEPAQASSLLRSHLQTHPLTTDGPWIELIGKAGGRDELTQLLDATVSGALPRDGQRRSLTALMEAQRLRKLVPSARRETIGALLRHEDSAVSRAAIQLAGRWKLSALQPDLLTLVDDGELPVGTRRDAVDALREFAPVSVLGEIAQDAREPDIVVAAIAALARREPATAVKAFSQLKLSAAQEPSQLAALWRAVLSGKNSERLFLDVLNDPKSFASSRSNNALWEVGLRIAREGGRKAPELVAALNSALGQQEQQLTAEEIKRVALEASQAGDPHRGELIYRKQELACTTCHAVAGFGGAVGPDLSSIGASAPIDYIAESLYAPNAKIKENYHTAVVVTVDGLQITGIETAESSASERVFRDASNKPIRIPRDDIEAETIGPSLMPAGLVERLSRQEQLDLIRFLSVLGKPGEFDASQRNIARRLEVLAGTHRREQLGLENILSKENKAWKLAQARLSGKLERNVLQDLTKQPVNISLVHVYVKVVFEVIDAGATVQANHAVAAWVDGEEATLEGAQLKNLSLGEQELVLRFDARKLPEFVRVTGEGVRFE